MSQVFAEVVASYPLTEPVECPFSAATTTQYGKGEGEGPGREGRGGQGGKGQTGGKWYCERTRICSCATRCHKVDMLDSPTQPTAKWHNKMGRRGFAGKTSGPLPIKSQV